MGSPPNYEGLVLSCIEAGFSKEIRSSTKYLIANFSRKRRGPCPAAACPAAASPAAARPAGSRRRRASRGDGQPRGGLDLEGARGGFSEL